ncbi:MAG TPA: hypothetical protein VGI06_15915, partial [Acidimicrobiales bacterium]
MRPSPGARLGAVMGAAAGGDPITQAVSGGGLTEAGILQENQGLITALGAAFVLHLGPGRSTPQTQFGSG